MNLYESRMNRVTERMGEAGISQLYVTDPLSILYLTGVYIEPYERFWSYLIDAEGENVLFSNALFTFDRTPFNCVTLDDADDAAAEAAKYVKGGTVGVDKDMAARFLLPIMKLCSGTNFVLGSDCIDSVRAIKDENERRYMREASRLNDEHMKRVAAFIHEGVTEKECAAFLSGCYAEPGCDGPAFDPVISFGANAADPHHMSDDTVIREGDCIVIDIGCKVHGYCADMTRTYFWKNVSDEHARLHGIVRKANELAESLVRPRIRLCELDAAARDHITEAGYGEFFTHRLGHFIGINEHEKGDVGRTSTGLAQPGMVFSIEPGIYLPDEFGARVEDLVLVTDQGCEILNHVEKGPVVLN